MKPSLSLQSISVGGLFKRFDYKIPLAFPLGVVPGLVVITAPNGYGKSTILKLLNDVAHGDYPQVVRVAFSEFRLRTSDALTLLIERLDAEASEINRERLAPPVRLKFSLIDDESGSIMHGPWESEIRATVDQTDEDEQFAHRLPISVIEREFPYLRRVGPAEWRDVRSGAILTRTEVTRLYEGRGRTGFGLRDSEPPWLTDLRNCLKILYISANRLRVEGELRGVRRYRSAEMVEVWAERIKEQIREVIRRYAEQGRRLEQAFPRRIISAIRQRKDEYVIRDNVERLIEEVRSKEIRYQNLGLVGEGQTVEIDKSITDPATLTVLEAYLEDIKSKFSALEDVAERLEIFLETINSMLLFKSLRLSADSGFEIFSDEGHPITPSSLSSGEQHLLVLLGELVFGSTGGTLILLDEPEISFHPEWQERFPKVLTRIIDVNQCAIVMATHSPTLIQDNWEAVVELADQVRR